MRKLFSFMMVTLDGCYEGPNQEFDWPNVDDEFNQFAISQLNDIGVLLFGRATYQGMAAYWPTEAAREGSPEIADRMNSVPKIVFSGSLPAADWNNTVRATAGVSATIAALKRESGKDLAVFGSSNLTVSLLEQNLVDELRVMVNPILLGGGPSLFTGLNDRVRLELQRTTVFRSGNVLLYYRPTRD